MFTIILIILVHLSKYVEESGESRTTLNNLESFAPIWKSSPMWVKYNTYNITSYLILLISKILGMVLHMHKNTNFGVWGVSICWKIIIYNYIIISKQIINYYNKVLFLQ